MLKPGTNNGLDHVGGVVDGLKQRVIVGTHLFYPFVINVYFFSIVMDRFPVEERLHRV